MSMPAATSLVHINRLEQALLLEEQLENKYGDEERDYVIRQRA